jgi:transcription-repair coupling factor (superfamily II helicase)
MSLIATPPIDRLAVRTFVLPFDPVILREAILREHFRGGQIFYACPRIRDLAGVEKKLKEIAPEVSIITAHGRMGARELEDKVAAFYDGKYDVLLSTSIIESGLDIPTANTLIVHRADMFGLSQLYQIRGRIGRSKTRAYAYLTLPPGHILTPAAKKRLEVLHNLDTLGAGFTLASHDLDIRGAGNLLGSEQSGHIREVGIELYQHMIEEAVAKARGMGLETDKGEEGITSQDWTPQITLGSPVLIPEDYIADLGLRLSLYRRIARLVDPVEIDAFAVELHDRFGPVPQEVKNLFHIVAIKRYCRKAGVEKVDAGPKGAVLSFYKDTFANPSALVKFIATQAGTVKLRPDHKLVYRRDWSDPQVRLKGVHYLMRRISEVAAVAPPGEKEKSGEREAISECAGKIRRYSERTSG